MLALEGRQLGNYDVVRRIRVGGMGAVYDGRQRTAFGRRVAIKVILGNYASDPEMRRRFAREARTIAGLHHPHILPLIEYGDEQGILYLVMPFIDGGTLTSYLRRSLPDLGEVSAIFLQLLDAVEYAHDQGLIHRDIKSSNVLLEMRRSGPPYAYLADFGLVRTSQPIDASSEGTPIPLDQVPGTPHYMAPEQTRGIVTTLTDIYALGVLLYQMLTGELPYDDPDEVKVIQMHLSAPIPSPCTHDASIPVEIGEVVRVAMAKRQEDRFHTIAELRTAFLAALEGSSGPGAFSEAMVLADEEQASLSLSPNSLLSTPLTPLLPPEPIAIAIPRRPKAKSTKLEPGRARTGAARPMSNKANIATTGKGQSRGRSKGFTLSIVVATVVPTVLLILLIMPRVLGFSFFPAGFPVFGTPAIATINVTPQSRTVQDTYVLIASPQVQVPDNVGRVIPDHIVQGKASAIRSMASTGIKSITAAQAQGTIFFENSSDAPISFKVGFTLAPPSGVEIQLTQSVEVPPRQNGVDGSSTALAMAVNIGVAGNIPAHALDNVCCNNGVSTSNPQPFVGGAEAHMAHVVTSADVDGLTHALNVDVQRQVQQQLQGQLQANEAMIGEPNYITTVSVSTPAGTQADQVNVQVSISATVLVYNQQTISQMVLQLLTMQAQQTLDKHYELQQGTLTIATPQVVSSEKNGVVHLSVTGHGLWVYALSPQQASEWRQSIAGAAPALAISFLNAQPGVARVQIHLPFGASVLPMSTDQIQIVLDRP